MPLDELRSRHRRVPAWWADAKLGILVDIEEAYTQCSKAFLRSSLWDPSRHVDRSELATNGSILRAIHGDGFDAEGYDRERAARYARREGFY